MAVEWVSNCYPFQPKLPLENKEGRFAVGANYDLYVMNAQYPSDSMSFELRLLEYDTATDFVHREGSFKVLNTQFDGGN